MENKTQPTNASVETFLANVTDPQKRQDCFQLLGLMKRMTGESPIMWGSSIIGFGIYHYKYATGREGDSPRVAFSPRKQNLTIYILPGFEDYKTLLPKLGKHKTGKSCLYLNHLADVDEEILGEMIKASYEHEFNPRT